MFLHPLWVACIPASFWGEWNGERARGGRGEAKNDTYVTWRRRLDSVATLAAAVFRR